MTFPRYPLYKESGVAWLGNVPEHWSIRPIKHLVACPVTDGPHETPQFIDEGIPFVSAEAVSSGRIDFSKVRACISAADNARYSLKYSPQLHDIYMVKSGATTGITAIVEDRIDFNIWSPLAVIRCGSESIPHFVLNFLRSQNFMEAVTLNWSFGTQQNIGMGVIENLPCVVPPLIEQSNIANFLNRETMKIDALVAEQRLLMQLLKEKRQAVISHAVTKGLNPDAPMKPSGVEWLGEVPAHWMMTRLRALFRQEKRQQQYSKPVLSVYRDYGVILKDSRDDNMNKTPDDLGAYQLVNPSDLVVNKMKAWQGSLGVSELEGITSPDYVVFSRRHRESSTFLHMLLRSQRMVTIYRSISNGIRPSQWRLEPDLFLGLPIFLPPETEQRQLVSFVTEQTSNFDTLVAESQRVIGLLEERRTALISVAVTGQIDVRQLTVQQAA